LHHHGWQSCFCQVDSPRDRCCSSLVPPSTVVMVTQSAAVLGRLRRHRTIVQVSTLTGCQCLWSVPPHNTGKCGIYLNGDTVSVVGSESGRASLVRLSPVCPVFSRRVGPCSHQGHPPIHTGSMVVSP